MSNTYVYELDDNLYINLTNKCSNNCDFCVRNGHEGYFGNKLWLEKEPTVEEVIEQIDYTKKYKEIVFCGFGEPTEKIDILIEIATILKKRGYIIRINTNGQGNLINGYDITKKLSECIDYINVSLNAENSSKYQNICHSKFGEKSFDELIAFAKKCRDNGIKTNLSIVDIIGKDSVDKCKEIAKMNNLPLRIRKYISDN